MHKKTENWPNIPPAKKQRRQPPGRAIKRYCNYRLPLGAQSECDTANSLKKKKKKKKEYSRKRAKKDSKAESKKKREEKQKSKKSRKINGVAAAGFMLHGACSGFVRQTSP